MFSGWLLDAACRPSFEELARDLAKMSHDPGRYLVIHASHIRLLLTDFVNLAGHKCLFIVWECLDRVWFSLGPTCILECYVYTSTLL